MHKKLVATTYALVITTFMPIIAYADLVTCGNPESGSQPCTINDFFKLFVTIFDWLLGMSAVVAMIFLIYGGIRMFLYSVDESNLQAGKEAVKQALIGLAIILLSYVLVNTLLGALGVKDSQTYFDGKAISGGK